MVKNFDVSYPDNKYIETKKPTSLKSWKIADIFLIALIVLKISNYIFQCSLAQLKYLFVNLLYQFYVNFVSLSVKSPRACTQGWGGRGGDEVLRYSLNIGKNWTT